MDALDEELDRGCRALMFVVFDSIADVEWSTGVDILEVFGHVECNSVEDFTGSVVDEFKFDVFEIFTDKFACSEIHYVTRAENGLVVAGTERVEFSESRDEGGPDLGECYEGIDVKKMLEVFGLDMFGDIGLESKGKFGYVFFFKR